MAMVINKITILFLTILLLFSIPDALISSEKIPLRPHFDKNKLPKGCASCHRGHGRYNTPMLPEREEAFCYRCHGNEMTLAKTKQRGDLSPNVQPYDISKEFEKSYHHPVEKTGIHQQNELLPEQDSSIERHAECVDCHHYHFVNSDNKTAGVTGADKNGLRVDRIRFQYQLCFKCHSHSANLPGNRKNIAELVDPSNASYHPIAGPGRNKDVPSLIPSLQTTSRIDCTSCHDNNNPVGPKGPHGSIYPYILAKNFQLTDGLEGVFQYELCYSCHRRESILANQSFPYHELHISHLGTSCRTCHNSHGSPLYSHLIDLDNSLIRPSKNGRLEFNDLGDEAGQCYLTCHNKEHDPKIYPGSSVIPSSLNRSNR
jgi:predicted CXXCH cytochrome family protein